MKIKGLNKTHLLQTKLTDVKGSNICMSWINV